VYEVWQIMVAVIIVSNCLVTCFMMTFNSKWDSLWSFAAVCDIVMITNIFFSFFVVYIDHRGIAYARCSVIAKKYLRGMFVIDVLSAMPFDYFLPQFANFMEGATFWWAMWRMNRLLGLIRVIIFLSEFSSRMRQIQGGPKKPDHF